MEIVWPSEYEVTRLSIAIGFVTLSRTRRNP